VEHRGARECWSWKGKQDKFGYGLFYAKGVGTRAHRIIVFLSGREIAGYEAHHVCENKGCVNPAHIEMLTPSQHRLAHRKNLFACKRGHPWTRETTRWRFPDGRSRKAIYPNRECRICNRLGMGLRAYPQKTIWTKEACIAALRECGAEDGRTPRATDFNTGQARRLGFLEAAARHKDRGWPSSSTIVQKFGSWREAIIAAGFEPRRSGEKVGPMRSRKLLADLRSSTLTDL